MNAEIISSLRREIARLEKAPVASLPPGNLEAPSAPRASARGQAGGAERVALGPVDLDRRLGGGLARGTVHEVRAGRPADGTAAAGFALGAALRLAPRRPLLWVRQDFLDAETGGLYAPGLAEFGCDPARLVLVRVRDGAAALRAGLDGARSPALGAMLLAFWGEPKAFDLSASRRLSLAAEASGVSVLLLRLAAEPAPSAAETRWRVEASPSRALEAGAPGPPAFTVTLERQRGGMNGGPWHMEWNRERDCFEERSVEPALSRPVVPVPLDRPVPRPPAGQAWRRAG
ncbi:ImuA family protein [Consotaella salsifontis]|uniref:Protein ImuA n=1 Tax=Consotaella salsifontis TaxID=1365950 RepID=A0A1T4SMR0_9HYPH|nr:hypothetical protein [Consotaella salsifontis]SKA29519.1 protein ImuA [Consotaella salsifontis]